MSHSDTIPLHPSSQSDIDEIVSNLKRVVFPNPYREDPGKALRDWDLWGPFFFIVFLGLTLSWSASVKKAKPMLSKGEVSTLVDPRLEGAYCVLQLERITFAASLCIRASPLLRPTISELLEVMVEGNLDREKWKEPKEKEQQEFWGFEDLECDYDSSFSMSPQDSISTRSP